MRNAATFIISQAEIKKIKQDFTSDLKTHYKYCTSVIVEVDLHCTIEIHAKFRELPSAP